MSVPDAVERIRDHARSMAEFISESVPGGVRAIFAGGSVASGALAWSERDGLEVYSDIDLYVVAGDAQLESVRDAARRAAAMEPPPGVRFLRPMDVGVYTHDQLCAQPARPGTVSLFCDHLMLHGDPGIVSEMREAVGEEVPPGEGLYLMENRFRELGAERAATDGGGAARLQRYVLAKTVLDCVTALRIGAGIYRPGNPGDAAAVEALRGAGHLPAGWNDAMAREALEAADDLPGFLSRETSLHGEAVGDLVLAVWRDLASRHYGVASGEWGALISARCRTGAYSDNFREFLALAGRTGRHLPRRAVAGVRLSRYSPLAAVRMEPMIATVRSREVLEDASARSLDALLEFLDALTAWFGFDGGTREERVSRLHAFAAGGGR